MREAQSKPAAASSAADESGASSPSSPEFPTLEFAVYATLPVTRLGFPFILQADWALATSRAECVFSSWNRVLVDVALHLLALLLTTESCLQENLTNACRRRCTSSNSRSSSPWRTT